jgi:hypothetical protein
MAYPTVSAPYGLQALNRVDGLPYAGAIRQIPIASTYNTAIYNGDVVNIVAGGTVAKSLVTSNVSANTATTTAGVFVGVQYVNSQGQTVQAQYYPGNAAATSAIAYVVDDPLAAFKVAVTASNSAMSYVNGSVVGVNMALVQGTGSSLDGVSGVSVLASSNAAGNSAVLPVRVIAVIPETAINTSAYTEVLVKFNNHQYNNTTGLDYVA